jgi:hypothetical protein
MEGDGLGQDVFQKQSVPFWERPVFGRMGKEGVLSTPKVFCLHPLGGQKMIDGLIQRI